jgi:hypothetical protein
MFPSLPEPDGMLPGLQVLPQKSHLCPESQLHASSRQFNDKTGSSVGDKKGLAESLGIPLDKMNACVLLMPSTNAVLLIYIYRTGSKTVEHL